jgi:hypothetical protein
VLQNLLVAFVVAVAAAYAAWALAPRTLRRRLVNRALAWSDGWSRCPRWLRARLLAVAAATSGSACDVCGSRSGRGATHADITRKHT